MTIENTSVNLTKKLTYLDKSHNNKEFLKHVKLLNFITPFSRLFHTATTLSVKNVSGYLVWSSLQTVAS